MIYKNVELYNVYEFVHDEYYNAPVFCRIPNELRPQLSVLGGKQALSCCGCEIRFQLVSESAKVVLRAFSETGDNRSFPLQIFFGCYQGATILVGKEPVEIDIKYPDEIELIRKVSAQNRLSFDPNLIRIILPYEARIAMLDVIGDVIPPSPAQVPKKKWLAYGSSITHGSASVHASGSYAMRTARRLGVDLINLGFAGSAMIDGSMADYIADREDWDFATLEMGVNVIWDSDTGDYRAIEFFKKRVDYFIPRIANAHPNKPIFCIDIFTYASDYKEEKMVCEYRRVIKEKVLELNRSNVHYISGRELLNSVTGLSADMIHPSDEGMEELSVHLSQILVKIQ